MSIQEGEHEIAVRLPIDAPEVAGARELVVEDLDARGLECSKEPPRVLDRAGGFTHGDVLDKS